jgi:hypothetical protein
MFININNTMYVANDYDKQIQVLLETNITTKDMIGNLSGAASLFVTSTGDVYFGTDYSSGRVDKWSLYSNSTVTAAHIPRGCFALFVDIYNTLYCSIVTGHQVVTTSLNDDTTKFSIIAGTGCAGPAQNMLHSPHGIFVDVHLDLYVADAENNRIQIFPSGQLNGKTVAGSDAPVKFTLNYPTGIVLDGDGYLFIVDHGNNRIIGSGPNGFRCLVGCSGRSGSGLHELNSPWTMNFDSYGNLFVTDGGNNRVLKFAVVTNACGESDNQFY